MVVLGFANAFESAADPKQRASDIRIGRLIGDPSKIYDRSAHGFGRPDFRTAHKQEDRFSNPTSLALFRCHH